MKNKENKVVVVVAAEKSLYAESNHIIHTYGVLLFQMHQKIVELLLLFGHIEKSACVCGIHSPYCV